MNACVIDGHYRDDESMNVEACYMMKLLFSWQGKHILRWTVHFFVKLKQLRG